MKQFKLTFLVVALMMILSNVGWGQIAAWDFTTVTSASPPATFAATIFNSNLVSTSGANNITRGLGASTSGANYSFRTAGFQNNGISTSNTAYFQITLKAATGYQQSLSTIDAKFGGTSTFYASPGVTSQFAYSLDGTNFTLIGSPVQSTSLTMTQIDLTGISALQNVAAGTTVTIRYYASGQTTTGGWGFLSASTAGTNGLAIGGTVTSASATPTKLAITSITPTSPTAGSGFNVTVQSQDGSNVASNVTLATAFSLSVNGYGGSIGGTTTGTILAGTNSITVSGVTLSTAGTGAVLTATRTSGDNLTAGTSSTFSVLAAADHLAYVSFPTTGNVGVNIATFTVEARRPDNSVDNTYTGNIVITKATGSGTLSGTTTKAAVTGVATFNDLQFNATDIYTLNANSSTFTQITSSSITITLANTATTLWNGGGSTWLTTGNWDSGLPSSSRVAQFGTKSQTTVGINMNTATLAQRSIAAIEMVSGANTRTINNSSTSVSNNFILSGAIINGVDNTILRNNSSNTLTIADGSSQTLGINLSNATNNIISIDGTGSIIISCIISGSNPLTKLGTGSGILQITGANTYTGLTTITGGTLQLNKTGGTTIPSTNNVTINGGSLKISTNQTINNLTMSSGSLIVDAGVTLTVTGTYNVTGGTINNLGTIKLNGGAVSFPGSGVTVNNGTANTLTNLEIASSGAVSMSSSFIVNGILTLTSNNLSIGANTLTLNGAITQTSGSLSSNTDGTVVYNQGTNGQSVIPMNYGNLTFSNFNKTLSGTIGIAGTLTPGTATGHSVGTSTIDYNGSGAQDIAPWAYYYNLSLSNAATKTFISGTTNIAGTFSVNGATADATTNTPTIVFNGISASQSVAGINYFNLTINNSNGVTLGNAGNVTGTLTLQSGVFSNGILFNKVINNGQLKDSKGNKSDKTGISKDSPLANFLTLGNGATLVITDGSLSMQPAFGTSVNITYNGATSTTGAEIPSDPTVLNNLTVNPSGAALSMGSDVTVNGTLTLSKALSIGAHTLGLNGTITGAGTLTGSSSSNLSIGGTGALGTLNFTGSSEILNNLTMNRTTFGSATFGSILNIRGTLDLSNGLINNGANTLTLGTSTSSLGTLTPATPTSVSYIVGNFERWIPQSTTSDIYFPVGTSGAFRQAIINYTSAPTQGGKLMVSGNEGDPGTTNTNTTITEDGTNYVIDTYSKEAWWRFTNTGIQDGIYDITLLPDVINGVSPTNFDRLRILKRTNNTSDWTLLGTHSPAGGSQQHALVKRTGLTGFSEFGIGGKISDGNSLSNAPLPVRLSSLNSTVIGKNNLKINWITESETNNSGFEIERKAIDGSYSKIGFISGHGTVNTPTNYSFEDRNLQTGKYKYRLKQIDNNGNFEYFALNGEVEIGVPKKFDLSQNYPNPFNPVTKINFDLPFDSKVNISLYDITGREVKSLVNESRTAGYHTVQFNASDLSSGIYFYRIMTKSSAKDFVMTKKMAVIK